MNSIGRKTVLSVLGALIIAAPALADNDTATKTAVATPSSAKTVAVDGERQLRCMGEAIKRLKRAAGDLAAECTQPVEMMGEIDIIGTDVIPIMPATAEGFPTQYVPPRPKYVNLHMSQISTLIPILEDDLNSLALPEQEKDYATPLLSDATNYLADVKKHYGILQSLTKTPGDYDAQSIVNECRGIHAALAAVDGDRKKLLHEDKKIEKENK